MIPMMWTFPTKYHGFVCGGGVSYERGEGIIKSDKNSGIIGIYNIHDSNGNPTILS